MYEKKIPLQIECGLTLTRDVLGGKWKPNLLFAISEGITRPSELQRALPDATKRVLNLQLKELEDFDIVKKKIYRQVPPKVEYSLTEMGKTLLPIIKLMNEWGNINRESLETVVLKRKEDNLTKAKVI